MSLRHSPSAGLDAIQRYRHIAPLEQSPQPIRVPDAINMELTIPTGRCLLTPAA